jgi:GT2 family glycosyltransferase
MSSTELRRDSDVGASRLPIGCLPVRPKAMGKFLFVGDEKLYVRGATYGAFHPDDQRREYTDIAQVDRDFEQMAEAGLNAVRIPHTVPPRELLDVAARHGLRVLVGLSAEQYAGFLADTEKAPDVDEIVRTAVRQCKGHPALLAYSLGNEISASMVRWLGRRTVERYLGHLCEVVKREDPESLVTYVNYPSTEYLQLPFLDFLSFNVYLETEERLAAYLARLQNLAGDRPLLMSELGLDSLRHGEHGQARSLQWQVRTTFAAGCTGAFIFSWTDEWYRGGAEVDDWAFGLTRRDRRPKPAFAAVERAFADAPFPTAWPWPRASVIVCVYNGAETIRDCCEGLAALDYPDYEVIVVDDGSKDGTAEIIAPYGFHLIQTANRGLSAARNTGLHAATGEIVAYTDCDARPDPNWLTYLAATFLTTSHVGIGGWNIGPDGDGWIADCVANAPGGPVHVLLSDREAEHIPGCSMAFRRAALTAIGGFDPQFRSAGDDVDVCWRLQEQGGTLGFAHGAMVWHHHRNSIRTYWAQQRGYGRAEAMLERKWPDKYNAVGHLTWGGRLYGKGQTVPIGRAGRIYQGVWGLAPFQHLTEPEPGVLGLLPLMPEWCLLTAAAAALSLLALAWKPLLIAVPVWLCMIAMPLVQALASARRARFASTRGSRFANWTKRAIVAWLHLLQPLARLRGRLLEGLTCWRQRGPDTFVPPVRKRFPLVVTRWRAPEERLLTLQTAMKEMGAIVLRGGDYDGWDLEVRGGMCGSARMLMATEDTGSGTQLVRARLWPHCHRFVCLALLAGIALSTAAIASRGHLAAVAIGTFTIILVARMIRDCGMAAHSIVESLALCGLLAARELEERAFSLNREQV